MLMTKKTVPERTEILANDHYVGIPLKITIAPGTVVKKGSPINASGGIATGADIKGILLFDVSESNPNGTIVVHGFIETKRAYNESGITITTAMREAIPMVNFN